MRAGGKAGRLATVQLSSLRNGHRGCGGDRVGVDGAKARDREKDVRPAVLRPRSGSYCSPLQRHLLLHPKCFCDSREIYKAQEDKYINEHENIYGLSLKFAVERVDMLPKPGSANCPIQ